MADTATITEQAWNSTKLDTQPDFSELWPNYRQMLQARAEAVIASGNLSGDAEWMKFEEAVKVASQTESTGTLTKIDDIQPFRPEPEQKTQPASEPKPEKKSAKKSAPKKTAKKLAAAKKPAVKRPVKVIKKKAKK